MRNPATVFVILIASFLLPYAVFSQNDTQEKVKSLKYAENSLFTAHDLVELHLITDFREMFKEIKDNADTVFHDGTAIYKRPDGSWDTLAVEIRPRETTAAIPHIAFFHRCP